jgi:integrase
MLDSIAHQHDLSRSTLQHVKALLSGIFNFAKQQGYFDGVNPVVGSAIPKARAGNETHAYSLEDVTRMLVAVPEPIATIVATAAFTGLRRGELRGLLWENYDGNQIQVTQSIWNSITDEPKTAKSKAPVPVVSHLRKMLDAHRLQSGNPQSGPMFVNGLGKPICLNNVANRIVIPALKKVGLKWHGWHAFRRGLATNLYRLGVSDKTIQAILRHANLNTTMNVYVKSVDKDSVAAMQTLDAVCSDCAVPTLTAPPLQVH